MIMPLILALLAFFEPDINYPLARVTSFIGISIAIMNLLNWFIFSQHLWLGILHLPLMILSIHVWILSRKKKTPVAERNE